MDTPTPASSPLCPCLVGAGALGGPGPMVRSGPQSPPPQAPGHPRGQSWVGAGWGGQRHPVGEVPPRTRRGPPLFWRSPRGKGGPCRRGAGEANRGRRQVRVEKWAASCPPTSGQGAQDQAAWGWAGASARLGCPGDTGGLRPPQGAGAGAGAERRALGGGCQSPGRRVCWVGGCLVFAAARPCPPRSESSSDLGGEGRG